MYNANYKNILKEKENNLIDALNLLDSSIKNTLKLQNDKILKLEQEIKDFKIDNSYKEEKNKEIDKLKLELNNILKDIDNIITNITK